MNTMVETELQKSFTWKIDNFSERKSPTRSPLFSSGGYEWYVLLHPKGDDIDDQYLSLYLCNGNPKSIQPGCKRRASLRFVILNQSGKEIHKTSEASELFRAELPGWGFRKTMRLTKLQDKDLLEKNTLIIEVYIKVTEDISKGYGTDYGKDLVNFRGFLVLPSQVISLSRVFAKHPNFAVHIKPTGKKMKTAYINTILSLIKKLENSQERFPKSELSMAYNKLDILREKGFKLGWLKSKLDEVSLEWKKEEAAARVQVLEGNVKDHEMMLRRLRGELTKEKFNTRITSAKVRTLEKTVANLKVELDKEKAKSDTEPKALSLEKTAMSDTEVELDKEKAETDTEPKVNVLQNTN